MITNEQRLYVLRNSNPEVAEIYGSLETARLLSSLTEKYNLEPGGKHVDVIGDIMLGFYERDHLPELLVSKADLTEEAAKNIAHDLSGFLNKLPENIPPDDVNEHEQIEFRPEGVESDENEKGGASEESERPITREELASYLKPKHTMHDDVAEIQGSASEPPQQKTEQPANMNEEAVTEHPGAPRDIPPKPENDTAIPRYARPLTDIPKYGEDDA